MYAILATFAGAYLFSGRSWPISTDRVIWALAAWGYYLTTGNRQWLAEAYEGLGNTARKVIHAAFDLRGGLFKGETCLKYIVLVAYLIVCLGCNGQQKSDTVKNVNIYKQDSMSLIVDKSNLQKEQILSWDYDQALVKTGKLISQDSFPASEISRFSIELYNFLPRDSKVLIKELTFEIKADTNLTVWYIEKEKKWQPLHYIKWHKYSQF